MSTMVAKHVRRLFLLLTVAVPITTWAGTTIVQTGKNGDRHRVVLPRLFAPDAGMGFTLTHIQPLRLPPDASEHFSSYRAR